MRQTPSGETTTRRRKGGGRGSPRRPHRRGACPRPAPVCGGTRRTALPHTVRSSCATALLSHAVSVALGQWGTRSARAHHHAPRYEVEG